MLWTVLRKDQYKIKGDYILIKGLGAIGSIRVRYAGRIHIVGEQGRAEVRYDSDARKWYMHISFEVSEKIAHGGRVKVPLKPVGDKTAGVDIGINNLLAVYVEDGGRCLCLAGHLRRLASIGKRKFLSTSRP